MRTLSLRDLAGSDPERNVFKMRPERMLRLSSVAHSFICCLLTCTMSKKVQMCRSGRNSKFRPGRLGHYIRNKASLGVRSRSRAVQFRERNIMGVRGQMLRPFRRNWMLPFADQKRIKFDSFPSDSLLMGSRSEEAERPFTKESRALFAFDVSGNGSATGRLRWKDCARVFQGKSPFFFTFDDLQRFPRHLRRHFRKGISFELISSEIIRGKCFNVKRETKGKPIMENSFFLLIWRKSLICGNASRGFMVRRSRFLCPQTSNVPPRMPSTMGSP